MRFFAYGSLMIPIVMRAVTGRDFIAQDARLRDYARFCVKDATYPGITQSSHAETEGVVYFDLGDLEFKRLDRFEGCLYRRREVRVETAYGELIKAQTYVVKSLYRHQLTSTAWSLEEFEQQYLDDFFSRYPGFNSVRSSCP